MRRREEGAGTALAVAVIAAVLVCAMLAGAVAVVLDARRRAAAAADAAALAGADTALGLAVGTPCARAGEVAAAGGAELAACEQRGALIRVRAAVPLPLLPLPVGDRVEVVAVAGPRP